MTMPWKKFADGFCDSPPAPLASARHLQRFFYISIGIAAVMFVQARGASPTQVASKIPLYFSLVAVELLLVWFVNKGIKARGYRLLDVVGWRWRNFGDGAIDLVVAAGTVGLLRFSGPVLYYFLGRWGSNTGFLLPKTFSESTAWIVVSIAAGFCEEFVYRGYLQRQFWSLTRSLPLALVLQAIIFACGHIYQGWKPALVTALYGLVFGLVAAWRRSVIPGALAHSVVDILAGFRI
jgi:membrane protease YdiL (CAAX protease family)